MISYFKYGKGHLDVCEDSLTASLFDLFKYLPVNLFWDILKQSLKEGSLPIEAGKILDWEYWPKWSAADEAISNTTYVEPDVFLRFADVDLIIEAKRYDANQQYDTQLRNEVIAYYSEYGEEQKPVYMLLVGGLNENEVLSGIVHLDKSVPVFKTNWSLLLDSITKTADKMRETEELPSHLNFVFQDMIAALGMHGFHHKLWLDSLPRYSITNSIEDFKLITL
jgi:hypothetical protein